MPSLGAYGWAVVIGFITAQPPASAVTAAAPTPRATRRVRAVRGTDILLRAGIGDRRSALPERDYLRGPRRRRHARPESAPARVRGCGSRRITPFRRGRLEAFTTEEHNTMTFAVGETVVYPHHGAALIEDISTRVI